MIHGHNEDNLQEHKTKIKCIFSPLVDPLEPLSISPIPVISYRPLTTAASRTASSKSVSRRPEVTATTAASPKAPAVTSIVSAASKPIPAVPEAPPAVVHPVHSSSRWSNCHVDVVSNDKLAIVKGLAVIRSLGKIYYAFCVSSQSPLLTFCDAIVVPMSLV